MGPARPAVERKVLDAWSAAPRRIPVLVGGCGSGRTTLLLRLAGRVGAGRCLYVDAERAASTPEAFWTTVEAATPFAAAGGPSSGREERSARAAFDSLLAHFEHARGQDGAAADFARLHTWGTPEQVYEKIVDIHRAVGHNGFMAITSYSGMPWDEAERNMRLFAREVMPELKRFDCEAPRFELEPEAAAAAD